MSLAAGSRVRINPTAFSDELVAWNDRPAVILARYGKLNGVDAYVISLTNGGTRILAPAGFISGA